MCLVLHEIKHGPFRRPNVSSAATAPEEWLISGPLDGTPGPDLEAALWVPPSPPLNQTQMTATLPFPHSLLLIFIGYSLARFFRHFSGVP